MSSFWNSLSFSKCKLTFKLLSSMVFRQLLVLGLPILPHTLTGNLLAKFKQYIFTPIYNAFYQFVITPIGNIWFHHTFLGEHSFLAAVSRQCSQGRGSLPAHHLSGYNICISLGNLGYLKVAMDGQFHHSILLLHYLQSCEYLCCKPCSWGYAVCGQTLLLGKS